MSGWLWLGEATAATSITAFLYGMTRYLREPKEAEMSKDYVPRRLDALIRWVAWKLPRRLVTWCGYRIGAAATTGEYSNQIVPELNFMEAMKRWDNR